ncbi:hypothetical protein J1614_005717 [Plenodomus biglobosus]|nr:hypothetical protein J1614_005717 [Plenodomus biglobosus]
MSGDIEVPQLLTRLREKTPDRQQQWAPIYKIISDFKEDVAKKQQIITCLGFRHVLETLPDRQEVSRHFTNPTPHSATGYWKMTWQFVVERELVLLLYEHLYSLATSKKPPEGVPIPDLPTIPGSDSLRELILYDFESHYTSLTVAPGADPIGTLYPPVPAAGSDGPETVFTAFFNELNLKYGRWNFYQHGLGLYSDLSSSIHK